MSLKLNKYIPAIVWMILIFTFSSRPDIPTNDIYIVDFIFKKTAHFFEYIILFLLWYKALGKKSPLDAFTISIFYAFTDEIHQLFVPGRNGLLRDVAIDSTGMIILSILIVKFDLWKLFLFPARSKKRGK